MRARVSTGAGLPLLFVLAYALFETSCDRAGSRLGEQKPSILLITIDTLRADRLGAYGCKTVETPNLDRIAQDSTLFEQVVSAVPLTLPSHATIFTGRYPPSHGIRDNGSFALSPRIPSITERLNSRGYRTAAFVGSYVLAARFGLNRGFDVYDDRFGASGESANAGESVERPAAEVIASAVNWLSSGGEQPFFCWVHLNDPHTPYNPPEPWRTRYAGRLYDGEVAYTDSALTPLISLLERKSWYRDMTIAVTADHGEALGEHREVSHGFFIYQSTLRVPLLLKFPGNRSSGKRVSAAVSLVDLAPTLLAAAGDGEPLAGSQGVDLSGSSNRARARYAETLYPKFNFGWSELRSIRDENWKYIEAPEPELYDLAKDPSEQRNLYAEQPDRAERMQRILQIAASSSAGGVAVPAPIDQSSVRNLRSLGYLAGRPSLDRSAPRPGGADPKHGIELYERVALAQAKLAEGRFEDAAAVLEQAVRTHPGIALAHYELGNCYSRLGKAEFAATQFRRAIDLNPRLVGAWFDLGLVQISLRDFQSAEASFTKAIEGNPGDYEALCYLGVAMSKAGKLPQAMESLRRAVALEPGFGEGWFELGRAQLRAQEQAAALESFERARATGFSNPQFHAEFGWLLMERNQAARAVSEYSVALQNNPTDAVLHNNLGFALAANGELSAAISAFQYALRLNPSYTRARVNLDAALNALASSRKRGPEARR